MTDADGTGVTRLTDDPSNDLWPSWSATGDEIAFMSNRDGDWEIYKMGADGSNKVNLTDNPADDMRPAWSPDGTKIAFHPELPISSCLDPSNAPSSTRAIVVSLTDAVNHPIKLTKPSLGVVS